MVQVTPLPNITVQNLTGSNLLITRPGSAVQESVSVGNSISFRIVPSQNFEASIGFTGTSTNYTGTYLSQGIF